MNVFKTSADPAAALKCSEEGASGGNSPGPMFFHGASGGAAITGSDPVPLCGGWIPVIPPLIDDVVSPGDAPDFPVFSRDGKMLNRPLRCVDHSFQDPFICPAVHGLHGGPYHGSHIGVELLEGFTVNGVSSLEAGCKAKV